MPAPAALAVALIGNHAGWMEVIVDHFRRDEVTIALVDDCFRVVDMIERAQPHFIVLDVDSVDAAVLEVCRKARAVSDAHITICCRRGGEAVVVAGFTAGADDVLTGHHSSRELAARMRAVIRRHMAAATDSPLVDRAPHRRYTCGSLTIDVAQREVQVADEHIDLTRIQFDILVELAKRGGGGAVTTREDLVRAVWGGSRESQSRIGDDARPTTQTKARRRSRTTRVCIQRPRRGLSTRATGEAWRKRRTRRTSLVNHPIFGRGRSLGTDTGALRRRQPPSSRNIAQLPRSRS